MPSVWMIWQLVDSAFPAGGFVHSGGLEVAWRHGHVRGGQGVHDFVLESLWQTAYGSIPLLREVHENPLCLPDIDAHADAFLNNHVANRASRAQGRALLGSARKVFDPSGVFLNQDEDAAQPFHLAPVFGYVTARLRIAAGESVQAFLYQTARGMISSAVRLSIVGPLEGQRIQAFLESDLERVCSIAQQLRLTDLSHTSPLLDLFQATQDRLYTRLFQS